MWHPPQFEPRFFIAWYLQNSFPCSVGQYLHRLHFSLSLFILDESIVEIYWANAFLDVSFHFSWSSICTYVTKKDPEVYVVTRGPIPICWLKTLYLCFIHRGSSNKMLYDINTSNVIPMLCCHTLKIVATVFDMYLHLHMQRYLRTTFLTRFITCLILNTWVCTSI